MDPARNGLWLSFLAGAATGVGGAFIVAVMDMGSSDHHHHRMLCFSLASAAGVMVAVSIADMYIPLVLQDGLMRPSLAVALGGAMFALMSAALNKTSLGKAAEPTHLLPFVTSDRGPKARERNLRLALLTFVALTLHNFPEGLAVSVSSTKSEILGLRVAIAVAIHNMPEGMAISAPLYAATQHRGRSIAAAFTSGMSEPLGIMIGVSFIELLPEAISQSHKDNLLVLSGFVCGALIMLITIVLV